MNKAIIAVMVMLSYAVNISVAANSTDAANFSTGTYGCTPALSINNTFCRNASSSLAEGTCINLQYKNSYFLPQIGTSDLNLIIPAKKLNIGLFFEHYGFSAYSEFSAGISFAKFFKPYFAFSLSASYYGIYMSEQEGTLNSGMVHLSLLAFPTNNFRIGFNVWNISFSSVKTAYDTRKLPSEFIIGISYVFAEKTRIAADMGKELKGPLFYGLGIEYMPVKQFLLRAGMSGIDKNISPSGGFGLRFGAFGLDFGMRYNTEIGLSMIAGLNLYFGK